MTQLPAWDSVTVGQCLATLELPPITRHALALYCGASGDHNPIHVDSDFAKTAGMPDVFAHGMLSAAWIGRALTDCVPQQRLRSLNMRFVAITHLGERIRCAVTVAEKIETAGGRSARLVVSTATEEGLTKVAGEALVDWNEIE